MITLEERPTAYLVPTLIDLDGAQHSMPPAVAEMVHGTVCWRPLFLIDGRCTAVIDKNGVHHYPVPLYRATVTNNEARARMENSKDQKPLSSLCSTAGLGLATR